MRLWHGFGSCFDLVVHEYVPKQAIVDLFWKDPSGWQSLVHTPFGIMDISDVNSADLDRYSLAQIPFLHQHLRDREEPCSSTFQRTITEACLFQKKFPACRLAGLVRSSLLLWSYAFLQYHGLWRMDKTTKKAGLGSDSLGMEELMLPSERVQRLTPFQGTIPLPRLLHQQIHACVEGRMHTLDAEILRDLQKELQRMGRKDFNEATSDIVALYLASFLYLSVLEEMTWDATRWRGMLSVRCIISPGMISQ